MIRVVCGCGRVFKAEVRHSGKRTRCPVCGTGLIIGQTPGSGSGDPDLDEVPSWWYPSDPPDLIGTEDARAGGDPDLNALPTTVFGPGLGLDDEEPVGLQADGPRTQAGSAGSGRSRWTLAGAIAAAMVLGVLCWTWGTGRMPGDARAVRVPRANAVPREAVRGPELAAVPVPPRNGSPAVRRGARGPFDSTAALLVPAYIYPKGDGRLHWRRLIDAAAKVDLVAVVNLDSGPGVERNHDYAAVITEAADRGVHLVGYINTQYAARPASEVKRDMDAWLRFYPRILGFFLDQQPSDARHSAYIADIRDYAQEKLRNALVITNPGIPCDESYLARLRSDLVCVFANFEGFAAFELPADLKRYEPSRYAALVYQVADVEAMRSMLKDAIIKRIGYVCVTDGKPPNPWSQLPSYWEAEVDAVVRLQ